MKTRELSPAEWGKFFDCFSRRFRGRPMTVELSEHEESRAERLAERLPLVGVTVEPARGPATSIAVMVGDSPHEHLVHTVRGPCRVRVAQLTHGQDEMLIINSRSGATTRVDFRRPAAAPASDPFSELFT